MTTTATGLFELNWDEKPAYDDADGVSLAKVTVTKKWRGDIEGSSVTELIKAITGVEASAGYVAVERLTGTLHGKKGSFVLQHSAIMFRGKGELTIVVVPDSGAGELKGIAGTLTVDSPPSADGHKYVLEYTIDPA